jgi:hypothetical protein
VSEPRPLAELSRRTGAGNTWRRRRSRAQWVLMFAGLLVLAAVASPTVRSTLVGLVLLVALFAALTVGLLRRIVRRHPLVDLAVGYLIGRSHARRPIEHYGPGYPPPHASHPTPPYYPAPPAGAPESPPTAYVPRNRCVAHGRPADE